MLKRTSKSHQRMSTNPGHVNLRHVQNMFTVKLNGSHDHKNKLDYHGGEISHIDTRSKNNRSHRCIFQKIRLQNTNNKNYLISTVI